MSRAPSKRASSATAAGSAERQDADEALQAWREHCVRCHGQGGRGDGPMSRMFKVADLTAARVARQSDAELGAVIRDGRNRMPAAKLPPEVIAGLVAHIRTLGR